MNGSLELRITGREPFAHGHPFAGPYERLVGRPHFAVDPDARAYADVVDLDKAPRNAGGLVEYATDVCMLKPVGAGNRRLFFGYGNRGHKRELQFFNDAPRSNDPRTLRDAGNAFLMRRGYTVVWAAWEGDLLPGDGRMLLDVPVAGAGGEPLTGLVRSEFIADARGRRVFDGVMPHVAGGGLMWMNHRFARVVSAAGQQYEDRENCADRFPFAYGPSVDHLTGIEDSILKRPETDPLVLHTQSATEYWQRHGSLVHTDTRGRDLEPPGNVRVYMWASSQHFADPNASRPARGVCQHYENVVQTSMLMRAMLDALDAWATGGVEPPASRIPRRGDGTLVEFDAWKSQFPGIPGVMIPSGANALPLYDFGPDFERGLLTREPPEVVHAGGYAVLVPAVDADGNDVAGVRVPMVEAPLGTYVGWNLRAREFGYGAMHQFTGSYIPFSDTDSEAAMTGDPRACVLARYGNAGDYVDAIETAARRLVGEGLMVEEDVERAVARAQDWSRPLHDVRL